MIDINNPDFVKRLRTLQIICGALMLGVVNYFFILMFQNSSQPNTTPISAAPNSIGVITALAFFMMALPASLVIARVITQSSIVKLAREVKQTAADFTPEQIDAKLLAVLQTSQIVMMAIVEGSAFFGGVQFMMTKQFYALIPMIGFIFFATAVFPTRERARAWMESRSRELGAAIEKES